MNYDPDFLNPHKQSGILPAAGKLLIAEPTLADPSFQRSVVFICRHGADGTLGFVLNRRTQYTLEDLFPKLHLPAIEVFQGGPVQLDTLHMLHRNPLAYGGTEATDGIYWGGSFEALRESLLNHCYKPDELRLFAGYAGWGEGQLEKELEEGSWIVANMLPEFVFESDPTKLWMQAVDSLGAEFAYLKMFPLDPQLN